jgi:hypothetical protein
MMMDYRSWIRDLQKFIADVGSLNGELDRQLSVAEPLKLASLEGLNESLRVKIPRPIARFLKEASGGCKIHFVWEPEGSQLQALQKAIGRDFFFSDGPLCDSEKLRQWQEWTLEGATEMWIAEEPEEKAVWMAAFPFVFMSDGDFLALDLRQGSDDPPVVFLCHEDKYCLVSPSFDEFLFQWQGLCYFGPDYYYFRDFLDNSTGYLSSMSPKAEALRQLLHPKAR